MSTFIPNSTLPVNKQQHILFFWILFFCIAKIQAQSIGLSQQFNGRYDFKLIGNTLNTIENNTIQNQPPAPPCIINTSSSGVLSLNSTDEIEKAYLYWAGSGTGDFDVKLNGQDIAAERKFTLINNAWNLPFFSAFKDVTQQVITTGNGTYTFSDLDLTDVISNYCPYGLNFGGWAIIIVYKNSSLPLNQLNIYDGLEGLVPAFQGNIASLTINLQNLNVIDNIDSKIGFIAWEGDKNISISESLLINGNIISNPPLNPANNIFNGTNSATGEDTLYNMDLDIYDLQNNIHIGDTSASIQMTSGQDFVMINAVVTKLNNQLPDATISINNIQKECNSKTIIVDYTVSNQNATDPLPSETPIAIYANNQLLQIIHTPTELAINESFSSQITLSLPPEITSNFELKFVIDDQGNGTGIITELYENNNVHIVNDSLWLLPKFNPLPTLISCNEGYSKATFNFSNYEELVKTNPEDNVRFYETLNDATTFSENTISNTTSYTTTNNTPKEIFVRIDNQNCFSTTSFLLTTRNCLPTIYNFISANDDKVNDTFYIDGLRTIFLNFEVQIYNRWGRLLWTGNHNSEDWNGYVKDGIGTKKAPDGTYFYLLYLNDIDFPEPLQGYLYLNH